MTYNVFGGTLNLAQFNSIQLVIIDGHDYSCVNEETHVVDGIYYFDFSFSHGYCVFAFSALALSVGHQEEHPGCKME